MQYDYARFLMELGSHVKQHRKERKLSHHRMVSNLGINYGQLAKIENGNAVSAQTLPTSALLADLVRGLWHYHA